MTIDAEVHFWKYGKITGAPLIRDNKILQEDYLPSGLSLNMKRNRVDACIAASAEPSEVETRFLSELALTHEILAGVVGWIDLQGEEATEKIAELAAYTAIRGYKLNAGAADLSAPQEILRTLADHNYTLELELSPGSNISLWHERISAFSDLHVVLEKCGMPDAKQAPQSAWTAQIRKLAENRNLFCKVSGLLTLGNWKTWKPADFYPFLDILFEAFGPNRLLYASDWPFLLLSGSYVQWKSLLEKYTEQLREEERGNFFGENARGVYRL